MAEQLQTLTRVQERNRRRIMDAALRLVSNEDGLHTSVEQICKSTSISRSTFYKYFTNLNDIFKELWRELIEEQGAIIISKTKEVNSDVLKASIAIRCHLERAANDHAWGWAMVNLSANDMISGSGHLKPTFDVWQFQPEVSPETYMAFRDIISGACFSSMVRILKGGAESRYPTCVADFIATKLSL